MDVEPVDYVRAKSTLHPRSSATHLQFRRVLRRYSDQQSRRIQVVDTVPRGGIRRADDQLSSG